MAMELRMIWRATMVGVAPIAVAVAADAAVSVDSKAKVFRLDGGGVTYAFGVDEKGYLQPLYWGPSLGARDKLAAGAAPELSGFDPAGSVTAQEYPGQGEGLVTEPGLKVAFADGNRDLVLKYQGYRIAGDTVTIDLTDIERPLSVSLRYNIDPATGIIARDATVRNAGTTPVRVDQIASAILTLPNQPDYRLHYFSGRHAAEWTLNTQPVGSALTVLESRRGSTGHQSDPWFAIDRASESAEESGPVWFGALAWSGSWRISVGADNLGRVKIAGGYNPYDFSWRLKPGESLSTPTFYAGYSTAGMGGASRLMHRFQLAHILPGAPAPKLRPVLYNSWEATEFNVNEAGQMRLAEKAAAIGVERFVVDDGWFGARNNDRAGLGDWVVNRSKFPNGLAPLIDKVHGLGMSFGLWVEPEMVNRDSDLYRSHPDWVLYYPGRPRTEGRNQLVLNLARDDVRDHLLKTLDDLLRQNDIQFLKWDYNRNWTEPGWPQMKPEDQQRVYVRYVQNLYFILSELRRRHPGVEIESCSGGGGRIDLGIMRYTDQVWPSDNTDPYDRLTIQDGFTHAYAPAVMMAWVTDTPNWANGRSTSLTYRFLSSMQGSLGIGANLDKWTDQDFATAKAMVAAYKTIRETVQRGDLYRLLPPSPGNERSATLYVSRDKRQAVFFQMLHSSMRRDNPLSVALRGLNAEMNYHVRTLDGNPLPAGVPQAASGSYWMTRGVNLLQRGDFVGDALVFEASDQS